VGSSRASPRGACNDATVGRYRLLAALVDEVTDALEALHAARLPPLLARLRPELPPLVGVAVGRALAPDPAE
jgi:hypothetical protein